MLKHKKSTLSLSKLQSPITTQWLHNNYEIKDSMTLPRNALYTHYLDFCTKNSIVPVNAASFGKIIRLTFPNLKTRRLGTRGQSKYHYYGISIKTSSSYYETMCNNLRQAVATPPEAASKKNQEDKKESVKATNIKSQINFAEKEVALQSSHTDAGNNTSITPSGTLLPDFPRVDSLGLDDDFIKDKVKTFLIMYRAHCQRILDTILRANFPEVENFLIHFWQGMPSHIAMILSNESVIDLIGTCDNILYKAIGGVLIPSSLQPLPGSLTQAIQQFAKRISVWLEVALYHLPEELQQKKVSVAKSFSHYLCRQTSLSHLAQAARTVLSNAEPSTQMVADLNEVKIKHVIKQTLWISSQNVDRDTKLVKKFFCEFTDLLEKQSPIEKFAEWISTLVNQCVVKPSEKTDGTFQSFAQEFLLKWSFITSKIIQELTLRSAKSFGSFHLMQMLFDDYIFHLIESHADILEEIYEVPQMERQLSCRGGPPTSPNYMDSFRSRHSSTSSSGRGSLSPAAIKEPNYIQYPNVVMDYNQSQLMFPYDEPIGYQHQEQHGQFKFLSNFYGTNNVGVHNFPPNFNQSNQLSNNVYNQTNQSDYYSADLEIVRQLQERTKSLMDASNYDESSGRLQKYNTCSADYNQIDNLQNQPSRI